MKRATTVAEGVSMTLEALKPGPGRAMRLARLAFELSGLSPGDRASVITKLRDQKANDAVARLFGLAEKYDVRAGHCMHGDAERNCFRSPCERCPDHPDFKSGERRAAPGRVEVVNLTPRRKP